MVDDRVKKISKDFYSSPISRRGLTAGYIVGSYIIGGIMTLITHVLAEIYIVASGGSLLGAAAFLKVVGLVLLLTMTNTTLVLFLVSFFKSLNAFATASTIIGTLIGFLTASTCRSAISPTPFSGSSRSSPSRTRRCSAPGHDGRRPVEDVCRARGPRPSSRSSSSWA
jgi:multidrug/hemolysin transport system permease protein